MKWFGGQKYNWHTTRIIGVFGRGIKIGELESKKEGVRYFVFEPCYSRFIPMSEYRIVMDDESVREMIRSIRTALC